MTTNNPVTQRKHFERYLTETDEKKLIEHLRKQSCRLARRDLQLIVLMRQTGGRLGATLALNVSDAMAAIREGRLTFRAETQKNQRAHSVMLNKRASQALAELLKLRKEQGRSNIPDEPLICTRSKKLRRLAIRSFQERMQMHVLAAGLTVPASAHWLRHTLAKRIMARSTSSDPRGLVQMVLGHSNSDTSMIYVLPDREELERAMGEAQ